MNICVQISVGGRAHMFSFFWVLRVELLDPYGNSLWGISRLFSKVAALIFPPAMNERSNIVTSLPTLVISFLCVFLIIDIGDVWSSVSLWFWFTFPWGLKMFECFSFAYWPFVYFLWRNVYLDPWPFKKLGNFFFNWAVRVLYSKYKSFIRDILIRFGKIFSPYVDYLFIFLGVSVAALGF